MCSPSHQFIVNNFPTQLIVPFLKITPLQAEKMATMLSVGIFWITASVLLTALQLKYQAKTDSPFQDHPKAMVFAIACLLIFCLGCDAEQYLCSPRRSSTFATLLHHAVRLLGFISLASLATVIFLTSTSSIPLLIIYMIFPWFFSARFVFHWIQYRNLQGNRGTKNIYDLHPQFALNSYFDYMDTLPVYHIPSASPV